MWLYAAAGSVACLLKFETPELKRGRADVRNGVGGRHRQLKQFVLTVAPSHTIADVQQQIQWKFKVLYYDTICWETNHLSFMVESLDQANKHMISTKLSNTQRQRLLFDAAPFLAEQHRRGRRNFVEDACCMGLHIPGCVLHLVKTPWEERAVEICVDRMCAELGVVRVQEDNLCALAKIADGNNAKRDAIVTAGGVRAVVTAMHAHQRVQGVQEKGMRALLCLAVGSATRTAAVVAAGGVGAVVAGMRAHASAGAVQTNGIALLRNFPSAEVVAAGGVGAVVAAMQAHADAARLQEQGTRALLCIARSSAHRDAIVEDGGVDAVVAGMQAHAGAAGMQAQGSSLIAKLLRHSGARTQAIVGSGGVAAVVTAMNAHVGAAEVMEKGSLALSYIAANGTECAGIVQGAGGLGVVLAGMHVHGGVARVQARGSRALAAIAASGDLGADAVVFAGGVAAVITGLHAHVAVAEVQAHGSLALDNIASGSTARTALVVAGGGVDAVVAGMYSHAGVAAVQEAGNEALEALVGLGTDAHGDAMEAGMTNRPASAAAVRKLQEVVTRTHDAAAGSECGVCMEALALEGRARQLPCEHRFHEECIVRWLRTHHTCPLCRHALPT